MKDASSATDYAPVLASWNAELHVHLIIGANPLAAARCSKSLEVGAKPIIITSDTAGLYYTLSENITNGSAQLVQRKFRDEDLTTLGRDEVNNVVDTVFVTLDGNQPLSMCLWHLFERFLTNYIVAQKLIFQNFAGG